MLGLEDSQMLGKPRLRVEGPSLGSREMSNTVGISTRASGILAPNSQTPGGAPPGVIRRMLSGILVTMNLAFTRARFHPVLTMPHEVGAIVTAILQGMKSRLGAPGGGVDELWGPCGSAVLQPVSCDPLASPPTG